MLARARDLWRSGRMSALGRWIGVGAAIGVAAAMAPMFAGGIEAQDIRTALSRVRPQQVEKSVFEGLELTRLKLHPRRVTAPLPDGRTAVLTIDPELQRSADSIMARYQMPEAGVVVMDVRSGDILTYASYVHKGPKFDVNARAEAPAASIFKVVTGAALVETAGLNAESEQCYHGGRSAITERELRDDPERDKYCASLAAAMGRSINVVFARLAQKHLSVEQLTQTAGAFGFGAPIPFEVSNQAPGISLPHQPLEFARASAGFWHTSLSPLAGASIAQTIARNGLTLRPRIVQQVLGAPDDRGERKVLYEKSKDPIVLRRAVRPETAAEVTRMMVQTTKNGSAYKTFHDRRRRAFLPNITVAGKTGTLTRHKKNRHYTWFVGFAPADAPEVAVSALVVNTPKWRIKGPDLARDALRAYFAQRGRKGVSRP